MRTWSAQRFIFQLRILVIVYAYCSLVVFEVDTEFLTWHKHEGLFFLSFPVWMLDKTLIDGQIMYRFCIQYIHMHARVGVVGGIFVVCDSGNSDGSSDIARNGGGRCKEAENSLMEIENQNGSAWHLKKEMGISISIFICASVFQLMKIQHWVPAVHFNEIRGRSLI